MSDITTETLERDLGRALVEKISPAELEFYQDLIAAPKDMRRSGDHALGFGVPVTVETVSLALLAVAHFVLPLIISAAKLTLSNAVSEASSDLQRNLSAKIKSWIDSKFSSRLSLGLTDDQVEVIIAKAKEEAKRSGLTDEKAEALDRLLRDILV